MPKRRVPRCVFGRETGYRCEQPGIGNPPLCSYHWDMVQEAQNREDGGGLLEEAVNLFVAHPSVQDVLSRFGELLDSAGAQVPHGIPRGHAAEAPPRPGNGQRARAAHAPPPPPGPDPRVILHFNPSETLTREKVKARQRQLAEIFHPDRGGSVEQMQKINAAAEALLSQLA